MSTLTLKGGADLDKQELREIAGAKLQEIRKGTGLSIFKVGRAIGVSGGYISQIERGVRPPSDAVLIRLAELYSVEQKELFGLYEKLPDDEVNMIMQMPELRNLFTELTSKKGITDEDRKEMLEEFKVIAKKYYNKDGD
ncbi:MAG: helix-turn-helix domain-containing protein [Clostridiales bacterium]|nr:helix-turn-helix domain-containing protein [Clostridiales bacterium]DAV40111.1 MAG TPA: helix-turn-helix domain protein [Caudoviricetes sp.]